MFFCMFVEIEKRISMFEKWRGNLDKRKKCGPLFLDLFKALDSPSHHLLWPNFEFAKQREIQI